MTKHLVLSFFLAGCGAPFTSAPGLEGPAPGLAGEAGSGSDVAGSWSSVAGSGSSAGSGIAGSGIAGSGSSAGMASTAGSGGLSGSGGFPQNEAGSPGMVPVGGSPGSAGAPAAVCGEKMNADAAYDGCDATVSASSNVYYAQAGCADADRLYPVEIAGAESVHIVCVVNSGHVVRVADVQTSKFVTQSSFWAVLDPKVNDACTVVLSATQFPQTDWELRLATKVECTGL